MASFIVTELGVDVPWHISRFFPAYKMKEAPATTLKTLQMAKEAGLKTGLNYIYIGNVTSDSDMDTKCPQCGSLLIERSGFGVVKNNIKNGHCPQCGTKIAGVGL
jgi:pyruvate formate lyase activating enzyme